MQNEYHIEDQANQDNHEHEHVDDHAQGTPYVVNEHEINLGCECLKIVEYIVLMNVNS
jgi:hypothetical protein